MGEARVVVVHSHRSLVGGLSNQMMALLGLITVAHQHSASLLLPAWRTNYPTHKITLADTYAVWGNITWPHNFPPVIAPPLPPDANQTSSLILVDGWRQPRSALFAGPLYIDILTPRPELQAYVDEFVGKYGTSYAALHARVEGDMRAHTRFEVNMVSLAQILSIINNSTLEKMDVLFVAVGTDLLPDDEATLNAGVTPWGGRLVRRDVGPATLSYLDSSILDMAICTQARHFVGFPQSTFSRMVHRKRERELPGTSFYYRNNTLFDTLSQR